MEEVAITKIITWTIGTLSGLSVLYRTINNDYREGIFTRRRNSIKYIRYVMDRKETDPISIESIMERELVFKHFFGKSVNSNFIDDYIKFYNKMGADFTCYSMKSILMFLKYNYELKEFQIVFSESKYKIATVLYWFGFILFVVSIFAAYTYVFFTSSVSQDNALSGIDTVTFILFIVTLFCFGTGLLFANDNIRKASYFKKQYEELNK